MDREELREGARRAVLAALDKWARRCGLPNLPSGREGATDADLPHLFPAIDAQVDRLVARADVLIPDYPHREPLDRPPGEG